MNSAVFNLTLKAMLRIRIIVVLPNTNNSENRLFYLIDCEVSGQRIQVNLKIKYCCKHNIIISFVYYFEQVLY